MVWGASQLTGSPSPSPSPSPEVALSAEVSLSPEVSPTPEVSLSPEVSPSSEVSPSREVLVSDAESPLPSPRVSLLPYSKAGLAIGQPMSKAPKTMNRFASKTTGAAYIGAAPPST